MYIDSLTITALVIFFAALVLFINYCLFKVCGMVERQSDEDKPASQSPGS